MHVKALILWVNFFFITIKLLLFIAHTYAIFTVTGCHVKQVEDVMELSECAYLALITVNECFKNIITEQVTVNELIKYNSCLKKLEAICTVCNSGSNSSLCQSYSTILSAMNISFPKYTYVRQFSQKLKIIVEYCSSLSCGKYHICSLCYTIVYITVVLWEFNKCMYATSILQSYLGSVCVQ